MADIRPTGEAEATQRQLIEEFKKLVDSMKSLSSRYDAAASQQNLLLPKLILQVKSTQSKINSIRADIAQEGILLKLKRDQIASAQQELTYRQQQKGQLDFELKMKQSILTEDRIQLDLLKMQQEVIRNELDVKNQELDAAKEILAAKQAGRSATESELQRVQEQYANEVNRRIEAGQGVTELEKQLSQRQRELKGALGTYDTVIGEAQQNVDQLTDKTLSLQGSLATYNRYVDEATTSVDKLQNEVSKLEGEVRENTAALEALPKEIKQLTSEADQLANSMAAKENQITKLKLDTIGKRFSEVGEALTKLRDKLYGMQQELGTTLGTAIKVGAAALTNQVTSFFSGGPILSFQDTVDTINAFQQEFGGLLSRGAAQKIAQESKTLGVSAQVFLKAQRSFLAAGGDATKNTFIKEFRSAGLTAAQSLKFAAENANLVAIAGEKYSGALARAAANAQKIGVSLDKTEGFADALVSDFEGSLERFSELRAMGVEVDFNRLAAVAGTGTPEEVQQELSSQLGGNQNLLDELQRNRFLKVALEKDLGLNVADIQKLAAGEGAKSGEETKPEETQRTLLQKVGERLGIVATIIGGLITAISAVLIPSTLANTAATNANTLAMRGTPAGGLRSFFGLGPKGAGPGKSPIPIPPTAPPAGGGLPTSGVQQASQGVSNFGGGAGNMLKIGLSMIALAGAMYILGKALLLFNDVNWESMAKMGTVIGVLGAVIAFAGPAIASGLLPFANPRVMAAILVLSLGLLSLGATMRLMAPAMEAFAKVITSVFNGVSTIIKTVASSISELMTSFAKIDAGKIALLGLALIPLSIGLTTLGLAGLVAAPGVVTASGAITILAGSIALLAGALTLLGGSLAIFGKIGNVVSGGVSKIKSFLGFGGEQPATPTVPVGQGKAAGGLITESIAGTVQSGMVQRTPKASGGLITEDDIIVGTGMASGGMIQGPGTPTSDNILTPTSPGEFVVNAKATKNYGVDMLANINKGTYRQAAPQAAPPSNVNVDMSKLESKFDRLASVLGNMKIEIDGNTAGRVIANSRGPLDAVGQA